ncbi:hypothetical protein H6G36_01315 [Anabaena minutissima FACHB-250]|nr:hypothetical protein [Anabaena minutissima FACHB-250]
MQRSLTVVCKRGTGDQGLVPLRGSQKSKIIDSKIIDTKAATLRERFGAASRRVERTRRVSQNEDSLRVLLIWNRWFLLQSLAGRKPTPPTLRYLRRAVFSKKFLSDQGIFSGSGFINFVVS